MYVHCGPMGQLGLLKQLEERMTTLAAGDVVAGIPYQIHLEFGLIIPYSFLPLDGVSSPQAMPAYRYLPKAMQDHLNEYDGYRVIEIQELTGEKHRVILGSALNAWMSRATTVQAVTEAIFRWRKVDSSVINGVGKGLNDNHIIFISVVHPNGGIPDDLYDELSRLMFEMSVDPVYHYAGYYYRSQSEEVLP